MNKGYFSGYDIHQAYRRAFSRPKKSWRKLTLKAQYTYHLVAAELNAMLDENERKEREYRISAYCHRSKYAKDHRTRR